MVQYRLYVIDGNDNRTPNGETYNHAHLNSNGDTD
jgi:hypothetical protein